jgi:hypothetical protein
MELTEEMKRWGIVSVPDAKLDGALVGGLVWWSLDGDVKLDVLRSTWEDAGLDVELLPKGMSPSVALRDALTDMKDGRSTLVRPLRTEHEGFILVHETFDDNGHPEYVNGLSAQLVANELVIDGADDAAEAEQVRRLYARNLATLSNHGMSVWLVRLVHGLETLTLKDKGGVYFVPGNRMEEWQRYIDVLRQCSRCRFGIMPAMRSKEATRAILETVTADAAAAIEKIEDELDAGERSGKRFLNTRQDRLREIEAQLQTYEQLLGVSMTKLRGVLDEASARIASEMLTEMGA